MKSYQHFHKVAEQVRRVWRLRYNVHCGRCGEVIPPGGTFTIVRLDDAAGNARSNLAPECETCQRSAVSGRWVNPRPPAIVAGGLFPWWSGEPLPPEVSDTAPLAPW